MFRAIVSTINSVVRQPMEGQDGGIQDVYESNNIDQNITWITPAHNYHPRHYQHQHQHQQPILLRHHHNHIRHHHVHHWGPFFEEDGHNSTNGSHLALQVPLGGSVYLNCRVAMLHDKTSVAIYCSLFIPFQMFHDNIRLRNLIHEPLVRNFASLSSLYPRTDGWRVYVNNLRFSMAFFGNTVQVMWLRRSADRVSLLTVGASPYTSDPRLEVKFQYPNNWRLHISPVQREDEGVYMCQVSTHPPRVLTTNVTVLTPELKVLDEHGHSVHDRYYKTGSTIELTCRIMTSAVQTASPKVTWSKDGSKLPGKVKSSPIIEDSGGTSVSRLVIPGAVKSDSGVYTCSLSKYYSVLVHVHVLNGEKQAAVQHDTWGSAGSLKAKVHPMTLLAALLSILTSIVIDCFK